MSTQETQMKSLEKVRELLRVVQEGLTRQEFVDSFKQVIALTTEIEKRLIQKIDDKLKDTNVEIGKAQEIVQNTKTQLQQIIQETRNTNETTLASLKKRALEAVDSLFTRLRLTDRFDALVSQFEGKIGVLNDTIASVPTRDDIIALIPPQKEETAEQTRDKLEILKGDERLDITAIKGIDELEKKIDGKIASVPRGTAARASNSIGFHDLSSKTNGSRKVFAVPKGLAGVLFSSDFPTVLMENNGFTLNANRTQLTIANSLNAPSTSSQLLYQYIKIFN